MDRKAEFENKIEELVKDFSDLPDWEIGESLMYLTNKYVFKNEK